jgi:hypothetical protein
MAQQELLTDVLDELDKLSIYEVQRLRLDIEYIAKWSAKLEVNELWQRLLAAVDTESK